MIFASYPHYDTAIDMVTVYISDHIPNQGRQKPESDLANCVFMHDNQIYANPEHRQFVIDALTAGKIPFRLVDNSPTSESYEA